MGDALERGMVLIFSIWNSAGDFMNWMDSGDAGPCNATEGDPKLILANQPDTHVTWVSANDREVYDSRVLC
jgi:cellulase